jgi:DNA-binding NtrC family response regulator
MVNAGEFRADLYYRLAVVRVKMPALRQRLDDLPALVAQLAEALHIGDEDRARLLDPAHLAALRRNTWQGNVRELRNHVERVLVLGPGAPASAAPLEAAPPVVDDALPYADARQLALASFERRYLEALLARHHGRVAAAARFAGVGRVYLYRLLAKHGIKL